MPDPFEIAQQKPLAPNSGLRSTALCTETLRMGGLSFDDAQMAGLVAGYREIMNRDRQLYPIANFLERNPRALVFAPASTVRGATGGSDGTMAVALPRDNYVLIRNDETNNLLRAAVRNVLGESCTSDQLMQVFREQTAPMAAHELDHLLRQERANKLFGRYVELGLIREMEATAIHSEIRTARQIPRSSVREWGDSTAAIIGKNEEFQTAPEAPRALANRLADSDYGYKVSLLAPDADAQLREFKTQYWSRYSDAERARMSWIDDPTELKKMKEFVREQVRDLPQTARPMKE